MDSWADLPVMDIDSLNARFEEAPAEDTIRWAAATFLPDIALSSSFQTQSLPLLHLVSRVAPDMPILFLDTGYHFAETLAFRDHLVQKWGLNVRNLRRQSTEDGAGPGADLYRTDPDLCCHINKVEPMRLAVAGLRAWISGIRRDQSPTRRTIRVVEQTPEGLVRVHPMATWTSRDVFAYIAEHHLPTHPLLTRGYRSIGCAPCTRPASPEGDERSGRWAGQQKTECGLHTQLRGVPAGEPRG